MLKLAKFRRKVSYSDDQSGKEQTRDYEMRINSSPRNTF